MKNFEFDIAFNFLMLGKCNRETPNSFADRLFGSSWVENGWETSQSLSWDCSGYKVC